MRYFLVDIQTKRHGERMLNNDENLYFGDNVLVTKVRNVLMTRFFKIVGRDEALKYEYSCLRWDKAKSSVNSATCFETSLNCNTPHVVISQITETGLLCWYTRNLHNGRIHTSRRTSSL